MVDSADPSQHNKKSSQYSSYLKYSGLAVQLLAAIGVCGWIGYKVDHWLDLKFPVFMMILGLVGFGGTMYQVYRSLNRE